MPDVPLEGITMNPDLMPMFTAGVMEGQTRLRLLGEQQVNEAKFVSLQSQLSFLNTQMLVGAHAAQVLDQDKTARDVLQLRATADQPGKA